MKANELMIGDWVLTLDPTHKQKVQAQIWAIEEGHTSLLVKRDISNWFVDIEWIEHIPLTPEILEKNGFLEKNVFAETMGVDELWGLEEYSCGVCGGEDDTWVFEVYEPWVERDYDGSPEDWGFFAKTHIKDIRYVHELQHALLLCGMDKKIEL